jgi:hypothetical protein
MKFTCNILIFLFFMQYNYAFGMNDSSLYDFQNKGLIHKLYNLSEGLQAASIDGPDGYKIGFFDKDGKLSIPFNYYAASDEDQILFIDGLAPAANGKKLCGYINKKGEWQIKPKFEYARSFYQGVAFVFVKVGKDERQAYITKTGSYFINPIYKIVDYFPPENICIFLSDNGKYGLMSPDGKIIIKPIYDDIKNVFEDRIIAKLDDKYGFIDMQGNKITEFEFDNVRHFINGTAIVSTIDENDNINYGVIDITGKYLISMRSDIYIEINDMYNQNYLYQDYLSFPPWMSNPVIDGVFPAQNVKTELFGLMNVKGEWVVEAKFKNLYYIGNKQFDYITTSGDKGQIAPDGTIIK